jgi:hypothetical protein
VRLSASHTCRALLPRYYYHRTLENLCRYNREKVLFGSLNKVYAGGLWYKAFINDSTASIYAVTAFDTVNTISVVAVMVTMVTTFQ